MVDDDFKAKLAEMTDITELNEFGIAQGETGDFDKAIMCFNRVLELEPENRNAYTNLGLAHYYMQEYDCCDVCLAP